MKNFFAILPENVPAKLEVLFKDEKAYKIIEPDDLLDILMAIEYTLGDV